MIDYIFMGDFGTRRNFAPQNDLFNGEKAAKIKWKPKIKGKQKKMDVNEPRREQGGAIVNFPYRRRGQRKLTITYAKLWKYVSHYIYKGR